MTEDAIPAGERLTISFQRTLRIPDDGRAYPLPPGLGRFPLRRVDDYPGKLPRAWQGDYFLPMYRREALWIAFMGASWKPNAVKVGVGGVDAISGGRWDDELHDDPQNYIVAPDQPWLDGINSGEGTIRQFVAMPLGEGYSVEQQITGEESVGGIQLVVFEPKPGVFPDEEPPAPPMDLGMPMMMPMAMEAPAEMGLGVGGVMKQKIYPDPYGIDTWDGEHPLSICVHLLTVDEFCAVTGEEAPSTPVDAEAYTQAGLPWFELYDETAGDLAPAEALARIRSIRDLEGAAPETGISVDPRKIRKLRRTRRT